MHYASRTGKDLIFDDVTDLTAMSLKALIMKYMSTCMVPRRQERVSTAMHGSRAALSHALHREA